MLFITYEDANVVDTTIESGITNPPAHAAAIEPSRVTQLDVATILDKQQGPIPRKRSSLCRHGDSGMCEYCSPLPPWDQQYLAEHKIKHKSFHAHLNELNQSANKANGSSYIPPLKEPSFEVTKNCVGGHKPWPEGICSKCQPSAITLQPQDFRMVDHVEFADSQVINTFIDSWRSSGTQRLGYLYGKYEEYPLVPLGIKAVVEAIYEPPQKDDNDGITLLPWEDAAKITETAKLCGLSKVGVIFTDLTDSGNGDGSVVCKRHKDSYFLSSLEVLFAAHQQINNPNYTRHSVSGVYSSKFVTCVISGNLEQEIEISSYQVSASAEGLVKADLISGSTHPSMVYINDKTEKRYVPDIFYKFKNQYNIVVKQNAKPAFPDDYLLVTLTHGFPQSPTPKFISPKKFPIENRHHIGEGADLMAINRHLSLQSTTYNDNNMNEFMKLMSDFHLVCYLFSVDILSPAEERLISKIATTHDVNLCFELFESPGWKTLVTIINSQ